MALALVLAQRQETCMDQRRSLEQRPIHAFVITPRVVCPSCARQIDPDRERAWSNSPYDEHVTCPGCGVRFVAELEVERRSAFTPTRSGRVRGSHTTWYRYLSPVQATQALLDIRDSRKPKQFPGLAWLHRNRPEVLYSAVKHYGDLKEARKACLAQAA